MVSSSEFVSQGHPDRTCDSIASYILDEYLRHDPKTRFAMEVQMKDNICNLAGEVTSHWHPTEDWIAELVRDAIRKVGYTAEYASKWPDRATLNAEHVVVSNFIGQQSPDIAQGVDREGWGDQGCFMGMATNEKEYGYMPMDKYFANVIGTRLYRAALSGEAKIGLDIKVLVSIKDRATVEQVVVAAPMLPENEKSCVDYIKMRVRDILFAHGISCEEIIVNGTGAYVVHSTVGDAGVVGRKLAVDFYGGNCRIGGGSPWTKDPTKADLTLNLYARRKALDFLRSHGLDECHVQIGCCIGQRDIIIQYYDGDMKLLATQYESKGTSDVIAELNLDRPIYAKLVRTGLPNYIGENR